MSKPLKIALPILAIIVVFFVFGLLVYLNQSPLNVGRSLQYFAYFQCFDTDGGHDVYTPGKVSAMNLNGEDYCISGSRTLAEGEICDARNNRYCGLVEYYCQGNKAVSQAKTCPANAPFCVKNACILPRNEEAILNPRAKPFRENQEILPYNDRPSLFTKYRT